MKSIGEILKALASRVQRFFKPAPMRFDPLTEDYLNSLQMYPPALPELEEFCRYYNAGCHKGAEEYIRERDHRAEAYQAKIDKDTN